MLTDVFLSRLAAQMCYRNCWFWNLSFGTSFWANFASRPVVGQYSFSTFLCAESNDCKFAFKGYFFMMVAVTFCQNCYFLTLALTGAVRIKLTVG